MDDTAWFILETTIYDAIQDGQHDEPPSKTTGRIMKRLNKKIERIILKTNGRWLSST
jgi:hypothetical protein